MVSCSAVRPGSARPYGRTSPALEYPAAPARRVVRGVGRYAYGLRGSTRWALAAWVAGTSGLALGGPFAIAHPIARYASSGAIFVHTKLTPTVNPNRAMFF
jgi:hypothetical protein